MRGYLLQHCKCCEFVGLREVQEEMVKVVLTHSMNRQHW